MFQRNRWRKSRNPVIQFIKSREMIAIILVGLIVLFALLLAYDNAWNHPISETGRYSALAGGNENTESRQANREQRTERRQRSSRGDRFAKSGVQVGDQVPGILLNKIEDDEQINLSNAWQDKPALLLTCSLTCPVARRKDAELTKIVKQYGDKINVVYIYTIEAHPSEDPSPYKGKVWVTRQNEKKGILHRQPKSLEQRQALARQFTELSKSGVKLWIDDMENTVWGTLGSGPNMGLLIGTDGRVKVKHGWFDGKTMAESIRVYLEDSATYGPSQQPPTDS